MIVKLALFKERVDRSIVVLSRLRQANLIEVSGFAIGYLAIVAVLTGGREGGRTSFGGVEEGIVPNSISPSSVVDDLVVGTSFEEVADREIEGEIVCLKPLATNGLSCWCSLPRFPWLNIHTPTRHLPIRVVVATWLLFVFVRRAGLTHATGDLGGA